MKVSRTAFKKASSVKSISAKEFLDLNKKTKDVVHQFSFEVKFERKCQFLNFYIYGKHYSKNRMDKWHRGVLLKYKKAIKQSFNLFFLQNKEVIVDVPSLRSQITYTVYNPKSRDDDANYNTLKYVRDALVVHGIIMDDSREYLLPSVENEVLEKEYKIKVSIELL